MCGLFGKISRVSSELEVSKFNALGVVNDERGGDSVGVFIDGDVEYGVKERKLYYDFMSDSEIIKNTKSARIALGHTRKASVGTINEDTAQPVCIKNQHGEIEFVLIHNGTIFNYLELAKEYVPFIETTGLTDSQIMANIFYYCGYKDVLEKYEGAMAMIAIDYRVDKDHPEVYLYKGASNKYRYSKQIEEERPLFLTQTNNEIWFSSLGKMLGALNHPEPVLSLKPNKLAQVEFLDDGIDLIVKETIDRSKMFQYKSVQEQNKEYNRYGYGYGYGYGFQKNSKKDTKEKESSKKALNSGTKSVAPGTTWINVDHDYIKDRVSIHLDGLYYINNKLAHGDMRLNSGGYKSTYNSNSLSTYYKEYWFYCGRLLPNIYAWLLLEGLREEKGISVESFDNLFPECIDLYSYIPSMNVISRNPVEVEVFNQRSVMKPEFYTGIIRPLFSYNTFSFEVKDGIIVSKSYGSELSETEKSFLDFQDKWPENDKIWAEEEEFLKDYMSTID